jgi:hypothetical protein
MDKTNERLIQLFKQAQARFADDHMVIIIPSFLSKKFVGYCSMREDLLLTIEYINILKTHPDKVIKSALSYSLIALYGKCFTDASKNNYPKLEPDHLFKDDQANLETHKFLIELRHQFIAHRGKTESEVGIAYLAVPKEDSLENSQVRFSQLKLTSFSDVDLNRIEKLIVFLLEKIMEKIQVTGQEVHDTMLKVFSVEELGLMMINNMK